MKANPKQGRLWEGHINGMRKKEIEQAQQTMLFIHHVCIIGTFLIYYCCTLCTP